ncbi:hypothetical protein GQ44DRAFT_818675 [Phaeosphaeriaceae sp. PMI808]|nr:hypothetical protein GQ44DRAFT_818675 [Phaeosphaeriaceae sp. PMI808]
MEDQAKRGACSRCRAQKLKCVKSTPTEVSSQCDRCRKSNTECLYTFSRPVGRPRTCRSQACRFQRATIEPSSQKVPEPNQPQQYLEEDYLNSFLETTGTGLDTQDFETFLDGITPSTSPNDAPKDQILIANEVDMLTPPTTLENCSFSTDFDPYLTTMETEDIQKSPRTMGSENPSSPNQDVGKTMQQLAEMGLEFHSQILKYQGNNNDEQPLDLISEVLRSSTNYLNALLSLDASSLYIRSNGIDAGGGDEQKRQTPPLDMPTAFQVLIPYVRLVQLHNILYETTLCRLVESNASPALCTEFPDIWVGGVYINASGFFRRRLLLQMNVHFLSEIECVLELPHEARICSEEAGFSARLVLQDSMGEGTACGFLRKAVSPRLLKMILDERDLVSSDIQSMRERIAQIKSLFYSSLL